MPLSADHWKEILRGFQVEPLRPIERPASWSSPVTLRMGVGATQKLFRLWGFEVTHGGNTRAADEYRVQVSNGPTTVMDEGGYQDVLLGYVPSEDVVVIYDGRYLDHYRKGALAGKKGSPSVQVSEQDLRGGTGKLHVFPKQTRLFGEVQIAVFSPDFLPAFLVNPTGLVSGSVTPDEVLSTMPASAPTLLDYCAERGFLFSPHLVARFVGAVSSKPFVILAGTTGTGKSKLAQLAAEYYSQVNMHGHAGPAADFDDLDQGDDLVAVVDSVAVDRDRIAFVPVRPDWTDNQALLGYYNPVLQKYEATPVLTLMLRARRAQQAAAEQGTQAPPYFLILDEMNLARVEHYFSDFLSLMESRKLSPGGEIEQEHVELHAVENATIMATKSDGTLETIEVPGQMAVPTNLYVVGTVNIDETTYGFSPKVLDRANVIEFLDVDLDALRGLPATSDDALVPTLPDSLPEFHLPGRADYQAAPDALHGWMKAVNYVLKPPGLHVGYRGSCEIAAFTNRFVQLYPDEDAAVMLVEGFDAALLQKVLPRLHGNRARLADALIRLHHVLRTGEAPPTTLQVDKELESVETGADALFPASRVRLVEMIQVLNQFGFVSFFR